MARMTAEERKASQQARMDAAKAANGNPATEINPETGKRRRIAQASKPLAATLAATSGQSTTGDNGHGHKRVATKAATAKAAPTRKPASSQPAAKANAAAKAKAAPAAPKAAPPTRVLARELVQYVVDGFADATSEEKQRIANYLKIVTTGTDENGKRWWPEGNFPRPTHFSWNA